MPKDKERFVRLIMEPLPSLQYELYPGRMSDAASQDFARKELAELGLKYVQLEEALGRPPEMKELGEKFTYRSKVLAADDGEAWETYRQAVESAKLEMARGHANVVGTTETDSPASPKSATPSQTVAPEFASSEPSSPRKQEAANRQQEAQRHTIPEKKRSWLDRLLGRG